MENGAKWGVEEEEEAGVSSTLGGKEGCGSGRRKEKGRARALLPSSPDPTEHGSCPQRLLHSIQHSTVARYCTSTPPGGAANQKRGQDSERPLVASFCPGANTHSL